MNTQEIARKYQTEIITRRKDACKTDYGKLLVIAGAAGMAGAAYLSGLAAFRSGVGMVRFLGPEENRTILQTLLPEAMYTSADFPEGRSDAKSEEAFLRALSWASHLVIGPGLSQSPDARAKLHFLLTGDLSQKKLILLDADALNLLAGEGISPSGFSQNSPENLVITPHIGEMARLTGLKADEILRAPAVISCDYAKKHRCIVVLKGAVTYVAFPDGTVFENDSGSPALAKAGSGDVLSGVIAGITAVCGDAKAGAAAGVYLHGRAGTLAAEEKGIHGILARDIAENISKAIKDLEL